MLTKNSNIVLLMYQFDQRIVMTLDTGRTNFVFSAIPGNIEILESISKL